MPRVLNKRTDLIPVGAVYVGRPSIWGNRFKPQNSGLKARLEAVQKYHQWIQHNAYMMRRARAELRGRDLVCWCAPLPCHADVLLKIANAE